ncbi:GntR family transcriptional regulator [Brevundimonas sp. VNH65]|uniref:GntR family transcriptional regulator n=1 Tax=Brevundimonas sp. VNH65 TaxID=3400917 RepID=UPI003BFAE045
MTDTPDPKLQTGAETAPNADAIAQALRSRIQKSEIAPGEWLREVRLCSEFGVGRSTVRRALRALADDGLIELEENRGARVSATTVEEVFDLYEVRAALYGLAARFACLRASDAAVRRILGKIDRLLNDAESGAPAEQIIEVSESIFSEMSAFGSADAQRMTEAVRRKTRFHFSYVALAINANGPGPYQHWRDVRTGLIERDPDKASQAARDILYFMQGEVARIMLARGPRARTEPVAASQKEPSPRRRTAGGKSK